MRKHIFLIFIAFIFSTQQAFAAADLPDTPVGQRAGEVLELLNEADGESAGAYIEKDFAPEFRDAFPMSMHVGFLTGTRAMFGAPGIGALYGRDWDGGVTIVILVAGGLLGIWLVRKVPDETLILITMLIGAQLIGDALRLSETSSLTAIFLLGLALAGLLVQYGAYLRERKAAVSLPSEQPPASSVLYFQDLELDG